VETDAVILFLVMLTVAAHVSLAVGLALAVAGPWAPGLERSRDAARELLAVSALPLAWVVATVATAGSLFLSQVAHFTPCTLCWYQRIAMYPLVVVLGIAAWRRDLSVRPYVLALTVAGLLVSSYHYLIERFPSLERGACDPAAPCAVLWIWSLHYISIPLMAATAFATIGVLMLVAGVDHGGA
jgi:disulfide bond formation protein DsbB